MDATAMTASLARWIEAINIVNPLTLLSGNVFQNIQKHPERQVTDLSAPHPFHSTQIEGLKEQDVVPVGQVMGQLEEPVLAPVAYPGVGYRQLTVGLTPVIRAALLSGKGTSGPPDVGQRLPEEQRGLYLVGIKTVVDGQEGLETKIKPRHFTGRGVEGGLCHCLRHTQIEIADTIPLDRNRLDLANQLPLFDILVHLTADPDAVGFQELVSRLLKREAGVLARLFEGGRSDLEATFVPYRLEKELVSLLDTLHDVLKRLRRNVIKPGVLVQLFEFGQMLHQGILIQMLARQLVVSFVQRDTVVVGPTCQRDGVTQMTVSFRLVQSVLVGDDHRIKTPVGSC